MSLRLFVIMLRIRVNNGEVNLCTSDIWNCNIYILSERRFLVLEMLFVLEMYIDGVLVYSACCVINRIKKIHIMYSYQIKHIFYNRQPTIKFRIMFAFAMV